MIVRTVRSVLAPFALTLAACGTAGGGSIVGPECVADVAPARETGIIAAPIELPSYYGRLAALAKGLPVRELVQIRSGNYRMPVIHIGPLGKRGRPRLLIVAGMRGNEPAAALAALSILADVRRSPERYSDVELHVITPASPIALLDQSPYGSFGCDVDRDFGRFRTPEARAIRAALQEISPRLVLTLHEGAHSRFSVVGDAAVPERWLRAAAAAAETEGLTLERPGFLGWFGDAGVAHAGWSAFPDGSLAAFAQSEKIGAMSSEGPGAIVDTRLRIACHLAATRALAREFGRKD